MCTTVVYSPKDNYFGRNLDLEYNYNESVTVVPRNYKLNFTSGKCISSHPAIIGMAYVSDGYPLYYDATNEAGLSMAGLNFPGNAFYHENCGSCEGVAAYELILRVLGGCRNLVEAKELLTGICITNEAYSSLLTPTPLHWIVAYKDKSIVVEQTLAGMKIYDNPVGVLTNNPPFEYHLTNLCNYRNVCAEHTDCGFAGGIELEEYSRGMGAIGLPGDWSSASRFVRAVYAKYNSVVDDMTERACVNQFFHILDAVSMKRGLVRLEAGENEITVYSSCCNTDRGVYYYTTYDMRQPVAVDMHREELDGTKLVEYPITEGRGNV